MRFDYKAYEKMTANERKPTERTEDTAVEPINETDTTENEGDDDNSGDSESTT